MPQNPPDGYQTVTPYAVVDDPEAVIEFAGAVVGGKVRARSERDDGTVMHAEITIGDSLLMVGGATGESPPFPAMLHVYVDDVDAVFASALARSAISLREPEDQFYGDRLAGVIDEQGNQWWFATRVEERSAEEMDRRAAASG